ncbi:hypothetical protein J4210_03855 [Candidatus Woesearchaeota archaeon]|nr:hypothetical protein [Candidatus Woesearchaeota archaeon]
MEEKVLFRTVLEVAGRPKEHVESSLREYLAKIKEDKKYTVVSEEVAEIQQEKDQQLWMIFAELEVKTASLVEIISFCFDYMPSLIEILEPHEIAFSNTHTSSLFNDLQARLHQVDMVAKQLRLENEHLRKNTQDILKNYILVLLGTQNLTSAQLSHFTGVNLNQLEDFLDQLIDEKKVDMKEGIYYLKEDSPKTLEH